MVSGGVACFATHTDGRFPGSPVIGHPLCAWAVLDGETPRSGVGRFAFLAAELLFT